MRVKVNSVVELFVAFIALECSISVDVVHVHSEVILRFVPGENEEEGLNFKTGFSIRAREINCIDEHPL